MKFAIPEISWHNRDPVLSVDFQPKCESDDYLRLATGGTDSHVLIWYISTTETGSVNLEVAADLTRHQKAVNVVRWSPNGQLLASGDDESIIFIWKQKTDKEPAVVQSLEQGEEQYKEAWVIYKTLRGHMEDVLDISWSLNSAHLASGSVDNKLIVWDVARGRYSSILTDHKGFVQGVSWDPQGQLIASTSSDRVFRTFDVNTKKVVSRSSKAVLPFPAEHPLRDVTVRLYHDDTLQTYYRRVQFSPDGLLLAVPAGRIQPEQGKPDMKPINAVYIYTRYSLKVPCCVLPCGEPALVTRWSPRQYRLRDSGPGPALGPGPATSPSRMVLAIGTKRSVMLYDTQQKTPIALISNIHYTRLTDLSWSRDGRTLVASSTDGFCSVIMFSEGELGEVLPENVLQETQTEQPMEVEAQEPQKPEIQKEKTPEKETKPTNNLQKIDSFIKFKAPSKKAKPGPKTPVKIDVLEEVAMPSWSDNSNQEIKRQVSEAMDVDEKPSEIIHIEDSEDFKLVYEETETKLESPKSEEKSRKDIEKSPKNAVVTKDIEKSPKGSKNEGVDKNNDSPKSSQDSKFLKQAKKSPKGSKSEGVDKDNDSPKSSQDSKFLKQAKVTDIREPVSVKAVASPKAPRRVSFVTLSSPKNKKKC